jgi:hypothetical protein
MSLLKQTKDYLFKILLGTSVVPSEVLDLVQYFRNYDPIKFEVKQENGELIAVSKNFRFGSIITSGKNKQELEKNLHDAILTSFDVPSSYAKEANLHLVGKKEKEYAFA